MSEEDHLCPRDVKIYVLELSTKSLKEGPIRGFDSSLRKLTMKSLFTCHVSKPILKVG